MKAQTRCQFRGRGGNNRELFTCPPVPSPDDALRCFGELRHFFQRREYTYWYLNKISWYYDTIKYVRREFLTWDLQFSRFDAIYGRKHTCIKVQSTSALLASVLVFFKTALGRKKMVNRRLLMHTYYMYLSLSQRYSLVRPQCTCNVSSVSYTHLTLPTSDLV